MVAARKVFSLLPHSLLHDGNIHSDEKMTKEDLDFYASIYLLTHISFVVQSLSCVRLCDPHGSQVSLPSLSPGVYSNSCPLSR